MSRTRGLFSPLFGRFRDIHLTRSLDIVGQDIRFGFRTMRKDPGAMSVTMLTLALSIGATTAIFSVGAAALLGSVAAVAIYVPARRAASLEPLLALKYE